MRARLSWFVMLTAPILLLVSREARAEAIVTEVYQGTSSSSPSTDQVEVFCYQKNTTDPACQSYKVCDGTWAAAPGLTWSSTAYPGTTRACSASQSSLGVGQRRQTSRGTSITTSDTAVWLEDAATGKVISVVSPVTVCPTGTSTQRNDNPSSTFDACAAQTLGTGKVCDQPHVVSTTGACTDPDPITTWSGNGQTCSLYSSDPECGETGCRGDGGQVWALMQAFGNTAHTSIKCGIYEMDLADDGVLRKSMIDAAARLRASGGTFSIATDEGTASSGAQGACNSNTDAAGVCAAGSSCCASGYECSDGLCVSRDMADLERAAGGTVTPTSTTINRPGGHVQLVHATGLMHDKICVFEGSGGPTVTTGSSNFKDTISQNLDLRLFVTGSTDLASRVVTELDELSGHCGGSFDAASKQWSVNCTTTKNIVRDNTNLSICGGTADLFMGPWSGAQQAASFNTKIRGRLERKDALLADPATQCGGYIGKCSNDLTRSCSAENQAAWATECGSATAGCLNACSPTPFHYHAIAGNPACVNGDCTCTTNADCTAGYSCDAVDGHAKKCAKETCVCDACFDDGLLATATRYRGSHFALTDNCTRRALSKIYTAGGTVEILQDELFWYNIYSASRSLCSTLNPTDASGRLTVKVENWVGKNHEKSFCMETASGPICHIGSTNISTNSNDNNTEDSLLFYNNPVLAGAFTDHLNKMMYGAKPDGSLYDDTRLRNVPECSASSGDTSLQYDQSAL